MSPRTPVAAALLIAVFTAGPGFAQLPAQADSLVATPAPTPRRPVGMAPT